MTTVLPLVSVVWTPRRHPLAPVAAVARGPAARALAQRLLSRDDPTLSRLRGTAGPGWIFVSGSPDDLPWSDGVVYVGKDPLAPALLVPTALEPSVPLALLERGLLARLAASPPLAVLVDPPACIPTASARPLTRRHLVAWHDKQTPH